MRADSLAGWGEEGPRLQTENHWKFVFGIAYLSRISDKCAARQFQYFNAPSQRRNYELDCH